MRGGWDLKDGNDNESVEAFGPVTVEVFNSMTEAIVAPRQELKEVVIETVDSH